MELKRKEVIPRHNGGKATRHEETQKQGQSMKVFQWTKERGFEFASLSCPNHCVAVGMKVISEGLD